MITKDEVEEMQAMIDGMQFTIEAQQIRLDDYRAFTTKLEKYFRGILDSKDKLIFAYLLNEFNIEEELPHVDL
jgi:hypothetical protein